MTPSEKTVSQEWFFYILRCRDNSYYSGIAINVAARLNKHNSGQGAKYTAGRRPVTLVYWEKAGNFSAARRREAQVKKWPKNRKERLVDSAHCDGGDLQALV